MKTKLRSNKDSGHGTLTRMFGTPSLPMFRRKYYEKSRQLNPALVQRKTILPVPLVLIPWCSASSRLRYSRSSEITRGRDQQGGQTSRLRIQSKTISLRSDLIRTIIKIIIKLAVIHSSGTGGRTVVVSGGWNVGQLVGGGVLGRDEKWFVLCMM